MTNIPKKPLSAYFAFAAEIRAKGKLSGAVNEQAKAIAELWAALPENERLSRSYCQKYLIEEWKKQYAVETNKKEVSEKHQPVRDTFAFKLFCVKALEYYKRITGKDLPYTLKVRSELEYQFLKQREQFYGAAEEVAELLRTGGQVNRVFYAWAD